MPETTYAEDWEYWLNVYQITRYLPELFEKMLELKEAYKNRGYKDKPLMRKANLNGKVKSVPVFTLYSVMAEVQSDMEFGNG